MTLEIKEFSLKTLYVTSQASCFLMNISSSIDGLSKVIYYNNKFHIEFMYIKNLFYNPQNNTKYKNNNSLIIAQNLN